jgi:hypothetical protein
MAKIYLINVGANTGHGSQARAPLFPDGSFEFVSFPDDGSEIPYPREAWPYVSDSKVLKTHADPDWQRLTYGDNCANRRAKALLSAEPGDMLLFWGLFWKIARRGKGIFACGGEDRRWCLFGALTVKHIIKAEAGVDVAVRARVKDREDQRRALRNAHVRNWCLPRIKKGRHDVLFVGDPNRSARFDRAVDLEVYQDNGLLRRTILSSDGRALNWSQRPRWNSSLRPCRVVLDHSDREHAKRFEILRKSLIAANPGLGRLWP